jgi:peptide subunit release factor 1 (eRF1)
MRELVAERLTRVQMRRRLPEPGPGRSRYGARGEIPELTDDDPALVRIVALAAESATGWALFERAADTMLVIPPFPVEQPLDLDRIDPAALVELLERRRAVALFLLRLGGFAVGFYRGDALVDSKTDRRFVKNRHRKGGQSQRRFERIREKQVDELFALACATARQKLTPYEDEIMHVVLGGDRRTLQAFRKQCRFFDHYGERLIDRVLHLRGDPRHASLEGAPRELWSSDVYTVAVRGEG